MNWNNNCTKPNCNCNSCNPTVNGNYENGILTVTVGTSTAVIPILQESVESKTFVKQEFNIGSGNNVILSDTPILNFGIHVYRNGLLLQSSEYVIINKVITFSIPFGNSTGATGLETLVITYYK